MPNPPMLFQKKGSKDGLSKSEKLNTTHESSEPLNDSSDKSPFERAAQKAINGIENATSRIPSPRSSKKMTKI